MAKCENGSRKNRQTIMDFKEIGRQLELSDALCACNVQTVQGLLARGADVNMADTSRRTPLMIAAAQGSVKLAEILLDHGADVNFRVYNGETALHASSEEYRTDVVKYLLQRGALVNVGTSEMHPRGSGFTPLMAAIPSPFYITRAPSRKDDALATMEVLLDHGADVDARGELGNTALHMAAAYGDAQTVALLAARGAALNVVNALGRTALTERHNNQNEILIMLLLYGYSLYNIRDTIIIPIEDDDLNSLLILYHLVMEEVNTCACSINFLLNGKIHNCDHSKATEEAAIVIKLKHVMNTEPLFKLCRRAVRKSMSGNVVSSIARLPVPGRIKQYLWLGFDLARCDYRTLAEVREFIETKSCKQRERLTGLMQINALLKHAQDELNIML